MFTEEILYKNSRTGTTAFYFVPNITPAQVPDLQEPAYVIFDNYNIPISFGTYASGGTEIWKLENVNGYNINVLISQLPPVSILGAPGTTGTTYLQYPPNSINYVTGYSISQTFNAPIPDTQRTIIEQQFNNTITSTITAQTQVSINYPTYVFFKEHEIDDMFANIKLSRSYETLDTLSIYNKPINSILVQEAKTGILFGKLEAIQMLKDEVGNNFKIPLKNVPIGIFNTSDEFPTPVSLDDNGDRFFMNLKETATLNQYFDSIAFSEDQKFLKTASQFVSMPDKFKFVTITNDNGEFVVYDVPVGSHTVVFEVDLFKQGLTKDEIILNNFPFPTNDDANVGEFPSYYFNQIPVDVVPAWGTSQTGYTELNISVNLELKKWATYIFPPAAYAENERLESTVAKNSNNTFKIQVRDMTNIQFAIKTLEITQVPRDLDRSSGSKYLWYNELLQQRKQLEFFEFGCHVLKLPANLYDPNGFRTDNNGVPTNQRGLWLAAYQFSAFINKDNCSRETGGFNDGGPLGGKFWSHFSLNFFPGAIDPTVNSGLGIFPYEKPWTINYPEPYHIPPMPVKKRFDYDIDRTFGNLPSNTIQNPNFIVEEPAYEDGDLVGNVVDVVNTGGFGVQSKGDTWFPNQIAYVATKDYMYKYEKGVRWNETYANGYEPFWTQDNAGPYNIDPYTYKPLAGMSSVNNGERYQRVECGYGYFMKYIDWPRVFRADWGGDIYFYPDVENSNGTSATPGVSDINPIYYGNFKTLKYWNHNSYNLDSQNLAFAFNQKNNNRPNNNTIDIYRIVESGLDNIKIPENFVISTFIHFYCDQTSRCEPYNNNPAWKLISEGDSKVKIKIKFKTGTTLTIQGPVSWKVLYNDGNPGSSDILYQNDTIVEIYPGGYFKSQSQGTIDYVNFNLPGNANYDITTNKYTSANYKFGAALRTRDYSDPYRWYYEDSFSYAATESNFPNVSVYTVGTRGGGVTDGNVINHNGLADDFYFGNSTYYFYNGNNEQDQEDAIGIKVLAGLYGVGTSETAYGYYATI